MAGNSLAAAQLLRKRLTASNVNEAMRRSMLSMLFAAFAAFLQVVLQQDLLHDSLHTRRQLRVM